MFANRLKAGESLAKKLDLFKKDPKAIVVAIPNGGILTAYPIAKTLQLPLEIELIQRVRHPLHLNRTIGAVSIYGSEWDKNSGASAAVFEKEAQSYKELLLAKHHLFLGCRAVLSLQHKTVILVDDGIQTGNTISLAIHLIKKKNPGRIILAIPIAPRKVIDRLRVDVDEIICLKYMLKDELLKTHYSQFKTVKDTTVIRLLREQSKTTVNTLHSKN
jgi:predicted phosphoribosyltransferase